MQCNIKLHVNDNVIANKSTTTLGFKGRDGSK